MLQTDKKTVPFSVLEEVSPAQEEKNLKKLSQLIARFAPHDGRFELPLPGIHIFKASRTNEISTHAISKPGMSIVAQGAKRVVLGQDIYEYDESRMVVYSTEVPITANIIKASEEEPYLSLVIQIDPQRIAELSLKTFPRGLPKVTDNQAIYVGKSNPHIISAAIRLIELIIQQEDADLLIPLVIDEILIRLLRPSGVAIAQIGIADSNAHKIAKAISWLKQNYSESMKVEYLAELCGMSTSSFHQHFKTVTAMSPLQFQKSIRLQEARNIMYSQMLDVSSACMQVGYTSLSQFSREYTRQFGKSPSRDISHLRQNSSLRSLNET